MHKLLIYYITIKTNIKRGVLRLELLGCEECKLSRSKLDWFSNHYDFYGWESLYSLQSHI
jgi:hypothetical protein